MARPLNPKQLKFVERYLLTGDATQSYIEAGYTADREAARRNASRLLTNADVKALVDDARDRGKEKAGLTAEWFAERVKLEAEREDEDASHAARVAALRLAGQYLGVISEKHQHEVTGKDGGPIKSEHDHHGITPEDIAAARAILGGAGGPLHPDGGEKPLASPP